MSDRDFLIWLHNRLTSVYEEDELYDYMHRFRAIIKSIPKNQISRASDGENGIEELKKVID